MLEQFVAAQLFAWLLVFARLGSAFMLLPGFGDGFVTSRARLILALAISVVLVPVLGGMLPPQPADVGSLVALLASEILIGAFLGTMTRIIFSALEVAGAIIAMLTGLAGASVLNPALATQGTLPGVMLYMVGLTLMFVTDLHHLLILTIVDSYSLFQPGGSVPTGDFADMVGRLVSSSFSIGIGMAAPFIVCGMVFQLGLGLIARLVPQIQVFFVGLPIQMLGGMALLAVTLAAGTTFWLRHFEEVFVGFLAGG